MNTDNLWNEFLDKIKERITPLSYDTWFKDTKLYKLDGGTATIIVPLALHKKHLEENYIDDIEETFNSITGTNFNFKFILENEINEISDNNEEVIIGTSNENMGVPHQTSASANLNSEYTFDSFIVGNSNRFAFTAARAVAEKPGKAYNPLFLYGKSGLGKTHLMHAIGNYILENSNKKVLYVSSEQFVNDYIYAVRNNDKNNFDKIDSFKDKYRNIDVLIIDDIQFLVEAEKTQQEFFHTFNALHQANKQIIISSDKSPDDLKKIEERLRSRFMWGLPVDIYPPDFNLRCEIIRSKVKNTSIENKLNDDVIEYIANSCVNDVRHIEGTINRLLAYTAMMVPDKITLDFANEALNDYVNTNIFINNSISSIQSAVAEYFKISVDDLKSKRRTNTVVKPRHIAMYLCRVETDENLMKIGLEFGGRDHSTVSTACDKIKEELEKNPNLNNVIKDIKMKLQ